jgi:hypothetical protein
MSGRNMDVFINDVNLQRYVLSYGYTYILGTNKKIL